MLPHHPVACLPLLLRCCCWCQGKTARIHVAELQERLTAPPVPNNPLSAYKVDQEVSAGGRGFVGYRFGGMVWGRGFGFEEKGPGLGAGFRGWR